MTFKGFVLSYLSGGRAAQEKNIQPLCTILYTKAFVLQKSVLMWSQVCVYKEI